MVWGVNSMAGYICGHCGVSKNTKLGVCGSCMKFPTEGYPTVVQEVEYIYQRLEGDSWCDLRVPTLVKPTEEEIAEWDVKLYWCIVKRTITEEVIAGQRGGE